jgi:opacity protein-like surface antigen
MNYKLGTTTTSGESSESSARTLGPSWIWTGLYGGIHFGGGWGTTNWKSADGMLGAASTLTFPGSGSAEGSIAGGQIGFNRQFGSWVAGAEISASWSNLDGYAKCATTLTPENSYVCHSRIESLVMTTGRLGQTYGNLLFYGLGGAAWATERRDVYQTFGMNYFSGSNDRFGYVLGSGIEYAFTAAWSGRLEYNYVDLGTKAAVISDQFGNKSSVSATQDLHLFKVGMNYKFGADPMTPGESGSLVRNAPPLSSDWQVEAGGRYWFSTGKSQQDLYSNSSPGIINSRLIYGRMDGHSAETFVRFDHHSGLFAKGNFGLGTLVNGRLNDEDMPPFHTPYSNTVSDMRSGTLRYGSLDIGHDILNGPGGKLGPFVGYRYFDQRGRGFGCAQVASSDICEGTGGAAIDRLALTETEQWRGVAVGLNSRMALSPRWKLELDAAYIPYVDRAGVDNHWGRADINPGPETGHGWGTQLEAILSYAVSERVSLGVGGRYWYFTTTHAGSQFPNVPNPSPLKFTSERYGGFLQASYKFGGPEHPARQAEQDWAANWNGIYVGGHLGGGFGRSDWTDPYPASVSGDRVRTGGVLGGAQLGFNYQTGNIVFGPEISGSLAKLEGTETCFGAEGGMNCENKIDALGTLTGRAGYVSGRSLFYAKSGAATARAKYMLNSTGIGGSISTASAVNWGWTAGGGVEHALTARWSVRLEYGYFDFGSRSIIFTVPGALSAVASEPVNSKLHQLLLGVNYHFDALSRPAN